MRDAVDDNRVLIFDTTLRDGEQAPGFSMGVPEKLRVAAALRDMGVDIIEAGFAAASPGDEEAIRAVAQEIEGPVICSLARASDRRHRRSGARAGAGDQAPVAHLPGNQPDPSRSQAEHELAIRLVLEATVQSITYARKFFDDVEFSAEDAIRTEPDFLVEVLQAAADAGATSLNVPDTVGYSTPDEIGRLFAMLKANIKCRARRALLHPLPQRSRHGGGEQRDGGAGRRAPDRMHGQRHRRARGQQRAGGSRDGPTHSRGSVRRPDQ